MNGTASESHRAGEEARRGTVSSTGHSGTDTRYDAMLRYLRGLYVRSPKTQNATSVPQTPTQPKTEPGEPPTQPSDPNAEPSAQ